MLRTIKVKKKIFNLENHDFTLKVFLHAHLRIEINVTHIF